MEQDPINPAKENIDAANGDPADRPAEDGRNKEWQDRARVNLEEVPEGTHTNVERDFEPEQPKAKPSPETGNETAY